MKAIQYVIKSHMHDNRIKPAIIAKKCGWSESRLLSILNGFQSLNSADYGEICNALGVGYSTFYYRSRGINGPFSVRRRTMC